MLPWKELGQCVHGDTCTEAGGPIQGAGTWEVLFQLVLFSKQKAKSAAEGEDGGSEERRCARLPRGGEAADRGTRGFQARLPEPGLIVSDASSISGHFQPPRGRCGVVRVGFREAEVMPGRRGQGS